MQDHIKSYMAWWDCGIWNPDQSYLCQVNLSHLKIACTTILKTSRKQKTVLSSGLFSYVFFSFQSAAFMILCHFSCPTSFDLSCQCVSWFFFLFDCVCVCLVILGCVFLFCWIFVCVLEFPIVPTISHGISKDGIQPFKGPKPAARIANSLENRAYWAACRGWRTPVPLTFPSLRHPSHLKQTNRRVYT